MQIYFFFTDTMLSTRYFSSRFCDFPVLFMFYGQNSSFFSVSFQFVCLHLFVRMTIRNDYERSDSECQMRLSNAMYALQHLAYYDESKRRAHKVRTWISNMNSVKRCNNKLISKDCLFIASHVPSFSSYFISHHQFVIFCDILSKTSKKFQWFELLSQIVLLFKWID